MTTVAPTPTIPVYPSTSRTATVERVRPAVLRIPDALGYLGGISKTTLWQLIRAGELETTRVRKQVGVFLDSMDAYLDRNRVEVRRPVRKGRR